MTTHTFPTIPSVSEVDDRPADVIVGEAVHVLMRRRGVSQDAMARAIGVHPTTFGKKVKGLRPWYLEELRKVAAALDVDAATFVLSLPRLDSNQQPSGYAYPLVSEGDAEVVDLAWVRAGRRGGVTMRTVRARGVTSLEVAR